MYGAIYIDKLDMGRTWTLLMLWILKFANKLYTNHQTYNQGRHYRMNGENRVAAGGACMYILPQPPKMVSNGDCRSPGRVCPCIASQSWQISRRPSRSVNHSGQVAGTVLCGRPANGSEWFGNAHCLRSTWRASGGMRHWEWDWHYGAQCTIIVVGAPSMPVD